MQKMELWYTEKQTPSFGITALVKESLYTAVTPYQELAVLDTVEFGRVLLLDGMVQTTERDEFVYHEMIAHVPMQAHPCPRKVMVIGGGDGGTVREVLRYPEVESVVLVEIDNEVIITSRRFFPLISNQLDNRRLEIKIEDGCNVVASCSEEYDLILIDSTEPVGAAASLFSQEFYSSVYKALKPDGMMVAQTESPFFNEDLIKSSFASISKLFPHTYLYLASVPSYPSGLWSFTIGSKQTDPRMIEGWKHEPLPLRYYNPRVHAASFALPGFVAELIGGQQ